MFSVHLKQFWQAPLSIKVALLEAGLLLAVAQIMIKLLPYSWWSKLLGPIRPSHDSSVAGEQGKAAARVAWAVHTMAKYLPWDAVCLPRAMVAKWMLARRNVPSTMFLGIARPLTNGAKDTDLHAWLRVGDQTITGGEVETQFTVIARFGS